MVCALAGIAAGLTTTVVGLGGGMMLLLILGLLADPKTALAWTAPALLAGNLHRVWMYRRQLDIRLARPLIAGAVPGSLLGAIFAVNAPAALLHGAMLAMAMLMVAHRAGWRRFGVTPRWIGPISLANGAVCACSGGAGLLTAPLLLSAGLSGEAWIVTQSAGAVAMHAGRLAGYGLGGGLTAQDLLISAGLALAVVLGNTLGSVVRRWLTEGVRRTLEPAAVLVCVGLAVTGLSGALAGP